MGETTGFLKWRRETPTRRPVPVRLQDWSEVYEPFPEEKLRQQAGRCMDCGIPFCNSGCPLGNLIPDWNDLVYREHWRSAIERLQATNNFPEFTGRLCPAPCEAACVLEIREGAASITQIELLGEPPRSRPDDLTPWPRWPMKLRVSYALHEGGDRDFAITTTKFTGDDGRVEAIHWSHNSGVPPFAPIPDTEETRPAQLVLLAMGFLHPEQPLLEALGVDTDARGNAKAGAYATSAEGVFAAGDARRGQSLIVWAINEGRQCARVADRYLRSLDGRDARAIAA